MSAQLTANPLDLRVWLHEIRGFGELTDVRGAHWNLELGAISELNVKKDLPPALLFDEIAGYPKGFRVLTCSTSSPARLSSILRLPVQRTHQGLVAALRGKPGQWQARAPGYDPIETTTGPALENVQKDAKVDVLAFPAPLWHEMDGGRYIGTGCSVVTRDFDSQWVNVGTYRVQVHDEKTVGLWIIPGKHGNLIAQKYWHKGHDCPFLIVCGMAPSMVLASAVGIPWGMSEYDFLGGLLGAPVPVVLGKQTELPMPANAELVLEGFAPLPEKV